MMNLQNLFSIFASFLFLLILVKTLFKKSSPEGNNITKLPPGPWKLPLIGNMHQLVGSLPHQCLRDLASKYGPLMYLKLGEVSNIIVTSPEMAQEIMKTQDINFSDRPQILLLRVMAYNCTTISFSPYGEYWRQLRKICTMELLTSKRVQSFRSIREEEVSEFTKTISGREGLTVNLSKEILSMTYGIAGRASFGKKNRYHHLYISAIEEALHLMGGFCVADLYPSVGLLATMNRSRIRMEKLHQDTDTMLQDIMDDHRKNKRHVVGNREADSNEDLVDVLLKLQEENELEYRLTDDNIKAVIQDMFVAGGGTSAGVVVWAMSEMMRNPRVLEAAQSEVRRVFSRKGHVDESELHNLTYVKCIIKETLRLHPPVPLLLPRENRERCEIKGYDIPAKCNVMINVWAIGRDPKHWGNDAEIFRPERFVNSNIDYRGTDFEFIPFGAGRRMCPGMSFASPIVELSLAKLLYHFDWKLPNGMKNEELDMSEALGITANRKTDLCLIPIVAHQP